MLVVANTKGHGPYSGYFVSHSLTTFYNTETNSIKLSMFSRDTGVGDVTSPDKESVEQREMKHATGCHMATDLVPGRR